MLDAAASHEIQPVVPPDGPNHLGCYSIRTHPRWACVYTHPQAEIWADTNLRRAGYRTYLPTYAARQRDRAIPTLHHIVTRPLFPRYLFVMFDHLEASWSPIRATPGVADLVRSGSEPNYARPGAVEALQATQDARRSLPAQNAQWAPGSVVRVANGIMAGHPGVVTDVGATIARVAIMFLGHLREISLPLDRLATRDV